MFQKTGHSKKCGTSPRSRQRDPSVLRFDHVPIPLHPVQFLFAYHAGSQHCLFSKQNNICLRHLPGMSHMGHINLLVAPWQSDPARKYQGICYHGTWPYRPGYKELGFPRPPGHYLFNSPDGIHWTLAQEDPVVYLAKKDRKTNRQIAGQDTTSFAVDTRREKSLCFLKTPHEKKRARHFSESDDLVHWTPDHLCLYADQDDPAGTEIYHNTAFNYASMWLGFARLFYKGASNGTDIQMIYSRDGRKWFRSPVREPVIPVGKSGRWDATQIMVPTTAPITMGDELWVYYTGTHLPHNKALRDFEGKRAVQIGLAKIAKDRFIAMEAKADGVLVSGKLSVAGSTLRVNCDVQGELLVEVLDKKGRPIEGLTVADCQPITGNHVAATVRWKSGESVGDLKDKRLRLRFVLTRGKLYSFRVCAE